MSITEGHGSISIPGRFAIHRASNQNVLISATLFLTVGIYLAVLGLGAGGGKPSSQQVSDIGNSVLYACFFISGLLGGSVMNKLGPRITGLIGAFGYPFYVAGFFYYDRVGAIWFPIFGCVVIGISAGLLWTVAGFIQFAYATERQKGAFIGVQYSMYQCGSTIGSLIAFIIIYKGTETNNGSPSAVYIAFICIMMCSLITGCFLVRPEKVRRADGTPIAIFQSMSFSEELRGAMRCFRDWRVLLILEAIFCCELPLTMFPVFNAGHFNARTRALNSFCFYAISPPLCWLISSMLDYKRFDRKTRGFYTIAFVYAIVIPTWIGLLVFLTNGKWTHPKSADGYDWSDDGYGGPLVLSICFGALYTVHQFLIMWIMSLFTNEPKTLAVYGGIFKAVAAAGLAVAFGMSAGLVSSLNLAITFFVLQLVALPICVVLVWKSNLTNYGLEKTVIIPLYAEDLSATIEGQDDVERPDPEIESKKI